MNYISVFQNCPPDAIELCAIKGCRLSGIVFRNMIVPMAAKRATTAKNSVVLKIEAALCVRRNYREVEVNKIAVIG